LIGSDNMEPTPKPIPSVSEDAFGTFVRAHAVAVRLAWNVTIRHDPTGLGLCITEYGTGHCGFRTLPIDAIASIALEMEIPRQTVEALRSDRNECQPFLIFVASYGQGFMLGRVGEPDSWDWN
jgi:hypothetical protein